MSYLHSFIYMNPIYRESRRLENLEEKFRVSYTVNRVKFMKTYSLLKTKWLHDDISVNQSN